MNLPHNETFIAYLLLGSNIGDKTARLRQAIALLKEHTGNILNESASYQTAPWGLKEQAFFLNKAVKIETALSPLLLLENIKKIEQLMGREATVHWGPRIIDIDILFYKNYSIASPQLYVPHKELHNRRFALGPLNEIASDEIVFPNLQKISTILANCMDDSKVELFLADK